MSGRMIGLAKSTDAGLKEQLAYAQLAGARLGEGADSDTSTTLVELFAYVGDVLSYYQEEVANEAYLETAQDRKRRSLRISVPDARPLCALVADKRSAHLILVGPETRLAKVKFAPSSEVAASYADRDGGGDLTLSGVDLQERFGVIVITDPRPGRLPLFRVWPPHRNGQLG
jgi:hypothetical protein